MIHSMGHNLLPVFIMLLVLIAPTTKAQETEALTETYASPFSEITFNYPNDWVVFEVGDLVLFASHEEAYTALVFGAPAPISPNMVAGRILSPTLIKQLFGDDMTDPADVLADYLSADTGGERPDTPLAELKQILVKPNTHEAVEPIEVMLGSHRALRVDFADETSEGSIFAISLDNREITIVSVSAMPGSYSGLEATVLAMLGTLGAFKSPTVADELEIIDVDVIELTHTHVASEGTIAFDYPDGWFVEDEGQFILISNKALNTSNTEADEPDPGQALIILYLPSFIENSGIFVGVNANSTPAEVLQLLIMNQSNGASNQRVRSVQINSLSGIRYDAMKDGFSLLTFAAMIGDGPVHGATAVVVSEQFDRFEPTLLGILSTFRQPETVPLETTLALLTPQNVGEVVILSSFRGHDGHVRDLTFNSDGTMLASAGDDQTVRLWNVQSGEEEKILAGHSGEVWDVEFLPDDNLVASASIDGTIRLWDVETGRTKLVLETDDISVRDIAVDPTGTYLVAALSDSGVQVWNLTTGNLEDTLALGGRSTWMSEGPLGIAYTPDGKQIAVGGILRLLDAVTGVEDTRIDENFEATLITLALAFSPDGKLLAQAYSQINVFDIETADLRYILNGHYWDVQALAFNPAGTLLVSNSLAGSIYVWDLTADTGPEGYTVLEPIAELGTARITGEFDSGSVAFNAAGTIIASGHADGSIRLWGLSAE